MEERSAVTAATTGALGPVITKLIALLGEGDEYKLQEGSRSDIELIKAAAYSLYSKIVWDRQEDLGATAGECRTVRELVHACKQWMEEARDLSFDMEDAIDDFMLGLERGREGFVQRTETSPFRGLRIQVQDLDDRWKEDWVADGTTANHGKATLDPRARFLHKDECELMEMGEKKEGLTKLLLTTGGEGAGAPTQQLKTVCILGFAGMGKTTLADQVYQTIGNQFQCRAFVPVSSRPDMMGILGTLLRQVNNGVPTRDTDGVTEHINHISKFLADKRYLVIVDDIWHCEEWEIIRKALPSNNLSSKIIITTRIITIAEKCSRENGAFIYKIPGIEVNAMMLSVAIVRRSVADIRIGFGEDKPCRDIVKMCRGMPLSLVCMSAALAERLLEQDDFEDWVSWWSVTFILDGFLSIPSLNPLVDSLCLGYNDLPVHLRTCLLYCSVYPDGHKIERHHLVRKWIAEGFVHREEAAESYFDELVARNLLHPAEGSKYEVHPVMLAFLVCKSEDANFVTCGSSYGRRMYDLLPYARRIRRLSLGYRSNVDFSTLDVGHTRSLVVFDAARRVPFRKFKCLRVLDLEYSKSLMDADLLDICELLCLRYLGLKGTPITELPLNIRKLQNLEILDVRNTGVRVIPLEIGQLPKLVRALADDGVSVKSPKDLLLSAVTDEQVFHLYRASRLVERSMVTCDRFGLITEPLLGRLNIAGRHARIPQDRITGVSNLSSLDIRLCKLEEDDLKFLQEMPNLLVLTLRFQVLPRMPITIAGGGFPRLQGFRFDCRLPRITFQPAAMQQLKYLEFKFYAGPASQHPMGITQLRSLQRVVFRCSPLYRSDGPGISATTGIVRKEAEEHYNRIILSINGNEEVFPEKKTTDICEENNINCADSSWASLMVSSSCDSDEKGLAVSSSSASCSRTTEIEEIESRRQ